MEDVALGRKQRPVPSEPVSDAPDVPPPGTMPGPRGCLIALGLGVVFGLGSIAAAGLLFKRKNEHRLHATDELAQIIDRGQQAPGADALRARGCKKAAILPAVDLAAIAQSLEDAEAKKKGRAARVVDTGSDPVAYCGVDAGDVAPSCGEVATAYVAAASPNGSFIVTLRPPMNQGCAERFAADGTSLGLAPPPNVPEL